jgi:cell division topological specificity factor
MWSIFDYVFSKARHKTASLAKERLSIIVAREGRSKGAPNYLPQLKRELLEVLAKYEKIDLDQVSVSVEDQGDCEVLELNVILGSQEDTRPSALSLFESPSLPRLASPQVPPVAPRGQSAVREATPFFEKHPTAPLNRTHQQQLS